MDIDEKKFFDFFHWLFTILFELFFNNLLRTTSQKQLSLFK
jgi:hypothetical protein